MPIIGYNGGSIVGMSGDSLFIARRVKRGPLCPDLLHPLVSRFNNKNTFIQSFKYRAGVANGGPVLNQYCVFGMDS